MHTSEDDDEENEEIMRANAHILSNNAKNMQNGNGNNAQKADTSKSAAENWKAIGNRHMACQVSHCNFNIAYHVAIVTHNYNPNES